MPLTQFWGASPDHQTLHQSGQHDALTGAIDANGRTVVMIDGVAIGTRRAINFVTGSGMQLVGVNNAGSERVDLTLNAPGTTQPKTGVATVAIGGLATPSVRTGHIVRVRAKRGTTDAGTLLVWLYENVGGVQTLRSGPHTINLTNAYATDSWAVPDVDVANIANYANLRVAFQGIAASGATLTASVSFVEMEIPT